VTLENPNVEMTNVEMTNRKAVSIQRSAFSGKGLSIVNEKSVNPQFLFSFVISKFVISTF